MMTMEAQFALTLLNNKNNKQLSHCNRSRQMHCMLKLRIQDLNKFSLILTF